MDIEKAIFPKSWKLKKDKEGNLSAQIIDDELDSLNVDFIGSEIIEIKTKDLEYISLSIETMYRIIDLIEQAEKKYSKP
jgi:hypothetical protein